MYYIVSLSKYVSFYHLKDNDDYKNNSGIVIDIGNDKTEIAVFNKGLLVDGVVMPNGSRLLDHDIGYIYHFDKHTNLLLLHFQTYLYPLAK